MAIVQNLPPMPVMARADQRWLTQALLAVIDNGLKFSDPGMALELALTQAGERAIITVSDSGPGILPREAPRIFDAYYQAEAGQMRGGTGLGLALALPARGFAHEVRPAYLEITERADGKLDVLWKQPSRGLMAVALRPRLDGGGLDRRPDTTASAENFEIARWQGVDLHGGTR